VNFGPLRLLAALRAVIAALLVAFGVVLYLSYGKKEEEPVRIQLTEPAAPTGEQVVDLSDHFDIRGTKGGNDAFRMMAQQVTGVVGDKKILKGVHLEVFGEGGERITLTGATGQFDMADRRAQLAGNVIVEGKKGFRLNTSSLYYDGERDMIFTPDEIAFKTEGISGRGRGLNYLPRTELLKIPSDVRVTATAATGKPVEIASGDMTLGLREHEVIFNDSVVLTRGVERFAGNYLKAILDESRKRLVSIKAYGQVSASFLSGRGNELANLKAESLLVDFSQEGTTPDSLSAMGGCSLENQGMTATCDSLQADAGARRISLRGDPVVVDSRTRIAAQEIDLRAAERGLDARGDVKSSFHAAGPGDGAGSPSYFSGKEPVYFQASSLVVEDGGNVARYSGSARGWQGDDSIQAEDIVLSFSDRRMKAFRNVLCRFLEAPAPAAGGRPAPPAPTVIVADSMDYDEAEGTIHFRGAVKLTRQASTILGDRMHVTLTEAASGRRTVDRVLAEGGVRFSHLANTGSADHLTYAPLRQLAEMRQDAGLAEVVDQTNGRVLRGKTLTFDLAGNRVLTETTEGGRTWISLSQKDKDGRGLEPKIGH